MAASPLANSTDQAAPRSAQRQRHPGRVYLRWSALALLTALLFGLLFYKIDFRQFLAALRKADWRLLLLAAVLALGLCIGSCILRLRVLLAPLPHSGPDLSLRQLSSVHLASCAAHNLLPAPAGEVVRTVQLHRIHGFPVGALVAAHLLEKVIESLGLGIETLLLTFVTPLPRALGYPLYAFAFLGVGGAALTFLVAWRWEARGEYAEAPAPVAPAAGFSLRRAIAGFILRLAEGIHLLHSPPIWLRSLFWSAVADIGNAVTAGLCLLAVGVHVHPGIWFITVLVTRLAGVVPSTPGQFGVLEAGVVLLLSALGVDKAQALAAGILYHAVHFIPVTAIGLLELRRQWR